MRKILALTLALVILLGTLSGCAALSRPLPYLKKSVYATVKSTLPGRLLAFVVDTADKGSIALDFGGTDLVDGLPQSAALKVWLNADGRKIAADGTLTAGDTVYDGRFWMNDTVAVASSAAFFGSNTLGVNFNTLRRDLETSIFSNNSGTDYARSDISAATTADAAIDFKNGVFDLLASLEDTPDLAERALDVFLSKLADNAELNAYREGGRYIISLSINNAALSRTLRDTHAKLTKNRGFCNALRKRAAILDDLRAARDGVVTNEYSTKLEYFLTGKSDIEEICAKIDGLAPFTFDLNATVRTLGKSLEKLRVAYTVENERRMEAAVVLAKDGEPNIFTFTLDGVTRTLTYQTRVDTFRTYSATLLYQKRAEGETLLSVSGTLAANRRDKTYALALTQEGDTREFCGRYDFGKKVFSLSVDSCTVNGEARKLSLSLALTRSEATPEVPAYSNLVTLDAARYAPIDERVSATKESFDAAREGIAFTPYAALADLLTVLGLTDEIPPPPSNEGEEN